MNEEEVSNATRTCEINACLINGSSNGEDGELLITRLKSGDEVVTQTEAKKHEISWTTCIEVLSYYV